MASCFFLLPDPDSTAGFVLVARRIRPHHRRRPLHSLPHPPSARQLVSPAPARRTGTAQRRGCLIPQTYEAHAPENVVHASLERPGSSDWAVLCSVNGTVSLLVFFSSSDRRTSRAGHLAGDWTPSDARSERRSRLQLGHRSRIARAGPRGATRHAPSAAAPRPRCPGRLRRRSPHHLPLLFRRAPGPCSRRRIERRTGRTSAMTSRLRSTHGHQTDSIRERRFVGVTLQSHNFKDRALTRMNSPTVCRSRPCRSRPRQRRSHARWPRTQRRALHHAPRRSCCNCDRRAL